MPRRFTRAALAPLFLVVVPACNAQQRKPNVAPAPVSGRAITFEDFATIPGVSDPQLSPDGSQLLYAVRTTDIAANKRTTRSWLMPVAGGAARQFPDASTNATEARWSPDGKSVAYVSGGQLRVADASGANKRQLTTINGGASGPVWSPAGDRIAFTTAVYPDCKDDACNVGRSKEADTSKVKAHIANNLLYRHWTAWSDGTRSHLYTIAAAGGAPTDLTAGADYDVPPPPFGGSEAYAWSPDGREIAYTAKDQRAADAWTTDLNLYVVPSDGSGAAQVITAANTGADVPELLERLQREARDLRVRLVGELARGIPSLRREAAGVDLRGMIGGVALPGDRASVMGEGERRIVHPADRDRR